ncbi:MAG TPA: hypothetical protein VF369_01160 [candidate division Zixibacteria bacterium]
MKSKLSPAILFIIFLLVLIIGCEKRSVTPATTDWDAVKSIIAQYPDIFESNVFGTEVDTLFYREITSSNVDIEEGTIHQADANHIFDYITLAWGDTLKGVFHYRLNGKSYQKPINSIALTNAYFEKWGDSSDPYRGWLFKQVSGTVINSVGATRHIYTVNILSEGVDVTLSESYLLGLVKKDSTLIFDQGKPVTLILDLPSADTSDFIFLYIKEGNTSEKIPFTNNGDGTLTASWTTTTDPAAAEGYKHAIVDVLNRESVTDTTYQYDSKVWGILYQIK